MSKLKVRMNEAVADDLGVEVSSKTITVKELADNPDVVEALVFAYSMDDQIYYDLVPIWRDVNGMRIKVPKFQSLPIIEERLDRRLYQRYYALGLGLLIPLKAAKPSELRTRLPFKIGNDPSYHTQITAPDETMALRKKPLLQHRRRIAYESTQLSSAVLG